MSTLNGVNGENEVNGHTISPVVSIDEFVKHEYDYLVLGGGTAGLVVAARLAELSDVKVGVIEAGKDQRQDMLVNTPAIFFQMYGNPEYDWKYMSTPQIADHGTKVHHTVRGKMLGGSSGVNYMLYVRGSDADYDDWADIVGDQQWSSKNLKQYMRKHQTLEPISENVTDRSTMPFTSENHGTDGPIHTSFNEWKINIQDDMIAAADKAAGYDKKPTDPWSGDHMGFYYTLAAISRSGPNKGKRSYATSYVAQQANLKIVCESHVTKINLNNGSATGASFIHNGQEYFVRANREVIVAGGVIGSPQILELSGIGDPDVLTKAGVDCKIENRAVGENLQDHICVALVAETPGTDTVDSLGRPEVIGAAMQTYMESQTGVLSSTPSSVQGFFPFKKFATDEELKNTISSIKASKTQTNFARLQQDTIIKQLEDGNSANLQVVCMPITGNPYGSEADNALLAKPLADPNANNGITLACCLQYPVSRGSTHINSNNPVDHPNYDPAFLTHPADLDVLAAGMKMLYQTSQSEPLASKLGNRLWPRPELDLTTTEDCKEAVKGWYLTEYHPVGSVAMGAALDSRLIVKGTSNIRVADASIFPGHVSGNVMSTVYMLAEKAADLIKEDWTQSA